MAAELNIHEVLRIPVIHQHYFKLPPIKALGPRIVREHSIFSGVLTKAPVSLFSRSLANRMTQPWLTPLRRLNALLYLLHK